MFGQLLFLRLHHHWRSPHTWLVDWSLVGSGLHTTQAIQGDLDVCCHGQKPYEGVLRETTSIQGCHIDGSGSSSHAISPYPRGLLKRRIRRERNQWNQWICFSSSAGSSASQPNHLGTSFPVWTKWRNSLAGPSSFDCSSSSKLMFWQWIESNRRIFSCKIWTLQKSLLLTFPFFFFRTWVSLWFSRAFLPRWL